MKFNNNKVVNIPQMNPAINIKSKTWYGLPIKTKDIERKKYILFY